MHRRPLPQHEPLSIPWGLNREKFRVEFEEYRHTLRAITERFHSHLDAAYGKELTADEKAGIWSTVFDTGHRTYIAMEEHYRALANDILELREVLKNDEE